MLNLCRQNFKKPSEELIARFKEEFPLVGHGPPAGAHAQAQSQQHRQQSLQDLNSKLPIDASTHPRFVLPPSSVGGCFSDLTWPRGAQ